MLKSLEIKLLKSEYIFVWKIVFSIMGNNDLDNRLNAIERVYDLFYNIKSLSSEEDQKVIALLPNIKEILQYGKAEKQSRTTEKIPTEQDKIIMKMLEVYFKMIFIPFDQQIARYQEQINNGRQVGTIIGEIDSFILTIFNLPLQQGHILFFNESAIFISMIKNPP